jgi:hypothetical protein
MPGDGFVKAIAVKIMLLGLKSTTNALHKNYT